MNQKLEEILQLALQTPEDVRDRTEDLNVGFDGVTRTWELIVKYHDNLEGLKSLNIQVEYLIAGYALLTVPEQLVEAVLEALIPLCEMMGILVIAVSTLTAFWKYFRGLFTRSPGDVKSQLASGLALSLEFKMAAEILKTVLVRDMTELMVLGAVIILRALLSFLIHFEMKQHDTSNHETIGGIVK